MAKAKSPLGKLIGKAIDDLSDRLNDVIGALAPQPDAIPVPVRDRDRPQR